MRAWIRELAQKQERRIVVAGAGPVGMMAALAVARSGRPVTLIGPAPQSTDRRTTALMSPALQFLGELGVLDQVVAKAAPLKAMRIVDGTSRLIRSPVVTFRAAEIGEDWFGLNVPNVHLNAALEEAVTAEPAINWRRSTVTAWSIGPESITARLDDGTTAEAELAVAADGRASPAREAAGIATSTRTYPQSALVLNFGHSRDHGSISTEFHTETGPFTQVPLPGQRSSLVWVVQPQRVSELAGMAEADLSVLVEEKMQSMLGRVSVEPGRQVYPLAATLPVRFAANRVALVGEAAHVFPPIGAQGLNLGIRDVVDLVAAVPGSADDPGSEAVLSAYDRKRRPDILARATAVNLLNGSLLSDMLPAQLARSAGLSLLGAVGPLRALFMREGLKPGSGFAAVASSLREQLRGERRS